MRLQAYSDAQAKAGGSCVHGCEASADPVGGQPQALSGRRLIHPHAWVEHVSALCQMAQLIRL